ncbi:hypothetical protein E2320_017363 [Naja naja]|nr:hypothetical protein E2320_017363 [Naja naja]
MEPIPTHKVVKQGCILAHLLFNHHINNIVVAFAMPNLYLLFFSNPIPVVLSADDVAILLVSKTALCRGYSDNPSNWTANNRPIEQVRTFTYLAIHFQSSTCWGHQRRKLRKYF